MPIKDKYYSVGEFAERHGVRKTLVRNAMKRGVLTFHYGKKIASNGRRNRYLDVTEADDQFRQYLSYLGEAYKDLPEHSLPAKAEKLDETDGDNGNGKRPLLDGTLASLVPGTSLHQAKAAKEVYLARRARLRYLVEKGELVKVDDLMDAWKEIGVTIQKSLLAIPDRTCQLLVSETDPHNIHVLLTNEIRHTLQNLSNDLANLAKQKSQVSMDDEEEIDE